MLPWYQSAALILVAFLFGSIQVSGGTFSLAADSTMTLDLSGAGLQIAGGSVGGSGLLTTAGNVSWTGGTITGSGGLRNTGTFTVSGGSSRYLAGVFVNTATVSTRRLELCPSTAARSTISPGGSTTSRVLRRSTDSIGDPQGR